MRILKLSCLAAALSIPSMGHTQQPVKDASVEEMVEKLSTPRTTRGLRNIVPQARPADATKPSAGSLATDKDTTAASRPSNDATPVASPTHSAANASPATTPLTSGGSPTSSDVAQTVPASSTEGGQLDLVIQFDFDSSNLQAASKPLLKKLAAAMNSSRLSQVSFMVEGHTDRKGQAAYNDSLSKRRADAVVAFLKASQVDVGRLQAAGRGSTELLLPDQPEAAENRRVRIVAISPTSQPIWLVTPEEALKSQAVAMAPAPKAIAPNAGPKILIASPEISRPISSPTKIAVKFETLAPAQVQPESFKVRYGAFGIDITERILAASKVTAQGIEVSDVKLPKGSHSLALEIRDSMGRVGQQDVRFVVE